MIFNDFLWFQLPGIAFISLAGFRVFIWTELILVLWNNSIFGSPPTSGEKFELSQGRNQRFCRHFTLAKPICKSIVNPESPNFENFLIGCLSSNFTSNRSNILCMVDEFEWRKMLGQSCIPESWTWTRTQKLYRTGDSSSQTKQMLTSVMCWSLILPHIMAFISYGY